MQGQRHGALTDLGLLQAKRTARALSKYKAAHVFSSDIQRAVMTSREIARLQSCPVEFLPELREIDCGVLENESFASANEKMPKVVQARKKDKYRYCIPKGESYLDVEKRVRPFLKRVVREFKGETVIVVAHEAVTRVALKILLGLKPEAAVEIAQPNDCAYVVDVPERAGQTTEARYLQKGKLHAGLLFEKTQSHI